MSLPMSRPVATSPAKEMKENIILAISSAVCLLPFASRLKPDLSMGSANPGRLSSDPRTKLLTPVTIGEIAVRVLESNPVLRIMAPSSLDKIRVD